MEDVHLSSLPFYVFPLHFELIKTSIQMERKKSRARIRKYSFGRLNHQSQLAETYQCVQHVCMNSKSSLDPYCGFIGMLGISFSYTTCTDRVNNIMCNLCTVCTT